MKRLYRSRTHKVIGGVAGGLGEYLDVDPVALRVAFLIGLIFWGIGFLGYIIAWIIIPQQPWDSTMSTPIDPQQSSVPPQPQSQPTGRHHDPQRHGSMVGGLVLLVLGLLFLAQNFLPDFRFEDWWPMILVAIGVGLLYKAFSRSQS